MDDLESGTQKKKRLEISAEGYTCLEQLKDDMQSLKNKGSITTIYGYEPILHSM